MFSQWINFILVVLALAPIALAEKPPAMVSSPGPVELGGMLASNLNQTPAASVTGGELGASVSLALPGRANSLQSGTLTTSDLVSGTAAPIMMADNKPKPPPPPPQAPKPKPKSKSKDKDKDDKDRDKD